MLPHDPSPEALTRCERRVAALLASGLTMAYAGELMHKAVRTADSHRQSAYRKLRIRNRSGLTAWAIQHGVDQSTPVKLGRDNSQRPHGELTRNVATWCRGNDARILRASRGAVAEKAWFLIVQILRCSRRMKAVGYWHVAALEEL